MPTDSSVSSVDAVNSSSSLSGWTSFSQVAGSKKIFLAAFPYGNDGNDGLSPTPGGGNSGPKATLGAAWNLVAPGSSDHVYARCGDTFDLGSTVFFGKNGYSADQPIVLGNYTNPVSGSTMRPIFQFDAGGNGGFYLAHRMAVIDIHVKCDTPAVEAGSAGIQVTQGKEDCTIEGCYVEGFPYLIEISWGAARTRVRRNILYNAWTGAVIVHGAVAPLIEENFIHKIGDTSKVANPGLSPHGVYVTNQPTTGGYTIRRNIFSEVRYSPIDARPDDGVIEENVIIKSFAAIDIGGGPEWFFTPANTVRCHRNAILTGEDWSGTKGGGFYGIRVAQGAGHLIVDNIIANAVGAATTDVAGMKILLPSTMPGAVLTGCQFRKNTIYSWGGNPFRIFTITGPQITTMVLGENEFQDSRHANPIVQVEGPDDTNIDDCFAAGGYCGLNNYYNGHASFNAAEATYIDDNLGALQFKTVAQFKTACGDTTSTTSAIAYPDPTKATAAKYNLALGGTESHAAFVAECLLQSKTNWRDAYAAPAFLYHVRVTCFGRAD
jgi:hypothetical protein